MSAQAYIAPDVYFPLEIVTREYPGQLLLATELATRGRTAVIGHKGQVAETMRAADRGGLLFYKNAHFPEWAEARHTLVGQDPEAGFAVLDYGAFYASTRVDLADSPSQAQFCFGPDEHDFLTDKHPDLAERIFLTGSPRVSLWGRDGDAYYTRTAAAIDGRFGSFVLFASSGNAMLHNEELLRSMGETTDWWNERTGAHAFFSSARRAAEALDVPVVIRPHPLESWTAWNRLIAPIENLHLEHVFELAAWTRGACAVVHPGESAAVLEAVVAGRPAISTAIDPTSLPISYLAEDDDHLIELLRMAIEGELSPFVSQEAEQIVRRKVLHPVEGAAQRIADVLDRILPADGPSGLARQRSTLRDRARAFASGARFRAVDDESQLGRTQPTTYKRPPLTLARVRRDVESATSTLGTRQPISVSQYAPNCFVLRR